MAADGSSPAVADVGLATALVAVALFVGDRVVALGGIWATVGGLLASGSMIVVPLMLARWRRLTGDVLAIDPPLWPSTLSALAVAVVVLPLYAGAYGAWATQLQGARLGGGMGLASPGLDWHGEPSPRIRLGLTESAGGLIVVNRGADPVAARVDCVAPAAPTDCAIRHVPGGGRVHVALSQGQQFDLQSGSGEAVAAAAVGAGDTPVALPLRWSPGLMWLAALLLIQFAAVALPEELFFRGYVLGRLRQRWPAGTRVFGTAFGPAHVTSAALFALIHLVTVPAPFRLAVFFPGLLFGWVAERTGSSVAAAVLHALCNVTLQVLQRLYG